LIPSTIKNLKNILNVKKYFRLGVVAHICNSRTWEAEAGSQWVKASLGCCLKNNKSKPQN
jgi:hypothetical protein